MNGLQFSYLRHNVVLKIERAFKSVRWYLTTELLSITIQQPLSLESQASQNMISVVSPEYQATSPSPVCGGLL
jgi:hypothetical protein